MRTTKNEPGIQPAPLHYITGMLALALVCCSLLCIYWYTTPAHASSGSDQANGKTMSGQVAFDETETETSSPTIATTPSPTVTTISTPTPAPSVSLTTTPSPTSARSATPTATVQPSLAATSTQTSSPGATPTSSATSISITTLGTGAHQTPVSSPAPTNTLVDQSSQGAHRPGNTFPFSALLIGLGSVVPLGLLFISGWMIVRRRLLSLSSPRLTPSGAAPWSRRRISDQLSPFTLQDNRTSKVLSLELSAGVTTATPGSYTSSAASRPGSLFIPGSNPPASLHALPTMAATSVPNLPVFSLKDEATPTATSPASHLNPPAGTGYPVASSDSSYLAARIRQRRNELRATAGRPAFQKQTPGELSAEITELNDPYLQSLIQLYGQRRRM